MRFGVLRQQTYLRLTVGTRREFVDPLTNNGWKLKGVSPDIITAADKSLSKVIEIISSAGK